MSQDLFSAPDYYELDGLLREEHLLVRDAARSWVKKEVSPIINQHAQEATFPKHLIKGLAEVGAFGPFIPEEYGGAGLDQISYGLLMQEIERRFWHSLNSLSTIVPSNVPHMEIRNRRATKKFLPKLASGDISGVLDLLNPITALIRWNDNPF